MMSEYSILRIPTIWDFPLDFTGMRSITYNCPRCDLEIEIDGIVEKDSYISCENCDHEIRFEVVKV